MKTPATRERFVADLRRDAGDYGVLQEAGGTILDGVARSYDLSHVRAWEAAQEIEDLAEQVMKLRRGR